MRKLSIVSWFKNNLVVTTLVTLAILFALNELVSGVFVFSRDAYITTDVIGLAPEVSGPLAELKVKDNQIVREGDVVIKINPEPFRLDLDRVQASYDLAKANVERAREEVAIAADRIASRNAQLDDVKIAFERAMELRQSGAVAQQVLDDARRAYDVATAELEASRTSRVAAEQEVLVHSASVYGAKAAVARAQYDLDAFPRFAADSGLPRGRHFRLMRNLAGNGILSALVRDVDRRHFPICYFAPWRLAVGVRGIPRRGRLHTGAHYGGGSAGLYFAGR
jgi:multidrug efflux pump subunit AcrA (membrane-fusion protein)